VLFLLYKASAHCQSSSLATVPRHPPAQQRYFSFSPFPVAEAPSAGRSISTPRKQAQGERNELAIRPSSFARICVSAVCHDPFLRCSRSAIPFDLIFPGPARLAFAYRGFGGISCLFLAALLSDATGSGYVLSRKRRGPPWAPRRCHRRR
jgi:hypothetical protein